MFLIKEGKLSVKKNLYLLRYKCCIPETSHIDFFLHLFPVCIVLEQENCDTIWSSYVFFVYMILSYYIVKKRDGFVLIIMEWPDKLSISLKLITNYFLIPII